ncbi:MULTISPECIES: hypothetical protein [unclassified Mesorhizobium]|uniref:hypothetical protein n=1 Tax=unclassified Mesorhizobium TaxID=325217 RepID=UPI0015E45E9A|nr:MULTISPECIES: hypothetical protein [unclassified Mesorhizobium]
MTKRFLGITVLPEFLQNEGIERVLDNLQRAGASAVSTSPYVMEPGEGDDSSREPPADGGKGSVRLLDRPLWGRRELMVRTAPSFTPDLRLYRNLAYQPPVPERLTREAGALVGQFIRAAKERGLKVYLQIMAAIPPGFRVQYGGPHREDMPRLPDGNFRGKGVDNNASLASSAIKAYAGALIKDLCRQYPEIDGFRIDWPEYPPYDLDSLFFDCSDHAFAAAARLGYDVSALRRDLAQTYRHVNGGLGSEDLKEMAECRPGALFAYLPGFSDMLSLKARLVGELLGAYKAALTEAGGQARELVPQSHPFPWSVLSGFDIGLASQHADQIGIKFYTMHWGMIVRNYVEALISRNPGLQDTELVLQAVLRNLELVDAAKQVRFTDIRYPEPDEAHWTGGPYAIERKLAEALRQSKRPIIALAHGYGPVSDVRERVVAAYRGCDRVWVNRYGYLSDEKLGVLGELVRDNAPVECK